MKSGGRGSFADDLRLGVPGADFQTVFDVGANVGQTADLFSKAFPNAHIWSFEPAREAFRLLETRHGSSPRVSCVNSALGATEIPNGLLMSDYMESTCNQVVSAEASDTPLQRVAVTTGDRYCADNGIVHIDFLKIDTEGYDLEVIKGFEGLIGDNKIDFIQVEVGMNPNNNRHVNIKEFLYYMEPRKFYMFGVYDQWREKSSNLTMRRANIVFAGLHISGPRPSKQWRRASAVG